MLPGRMALLLADTPPRREVLLCRHGLMARRGVVALPQAEVRRRLFRRLGALPRDALERGGQELGIVAIGPRDGGAPGPSGRVYPEAPLHPLLPRSVGLRPTQSPPLRAWPMAASAACHGPSPPPSASPGSTTTAQMRPKVPRWHHGWRWR